MSYAKNLVYFPPNGKMYYVANGDAVFEVTLDRSDLNRSSVIQVSGISGDVPTLRETGFAYDSTNRIIGGGVRDGMFSAYDPLKKAWTSRVMLPDPPGGSIGTLAFHALSYDPVNNVFVFITNYASGRHTWVYRYGTSTGTGDTMPPAAPAGLTAAVVSKSQIDLSWGPSSDNVGVLGYKKYIRKPIS
jgi:hypothetical protein